jgi:hypothetical protein
MGHQRLSRRRSARPHGLIKKIGHRYKYYLTKLGRSIVATALSIRESTVIPTWNSETA